MDTTEYEQQQTRLQATTRDWILRGEPNAFVTLTFKSEAEVSFRYAEKVFGTFAHELKCQLFGKKSKKRILMVPIIEGYASKQQRAALTADQRTHVHSLFRFPQNPTNYKETVRQIWVGSSGVCGDPTIYCPDNERWFRELVGDETKRIHTNYALKTCGQDTEAVLWKFVPSGHLI